MSMWFLIEHLSFKTIRCVPFVLIIILYQEIIQPNIAMFVEKCFYFENWSSIFSILIEDNFNEGSHLVTFPQPYWKTLILRTYLLTYHHLDWRFFYFMKGSCHLSEPLLKVLIHSLKTIQTFTIIFFFNAFFLRSWPVTHVSNAGQKNELTQLQFCVL